MKVLLARWVFLKLRDVDDHESQALVALDQELSQFRIVARTPDRVGAMCCMCWSFVEEFDRLTSRLGI